MKKDKFQNYIAIGITGFLMIAASVLFFFLLFRLDSIRSALRKVTLLLEPFFVGAVFAYLTAPLYNLVMRNVEPLLPKKLKPRHRRSVSVVAALVVSISTAIFIIVGLLSLVIPRFIDSIIGISASLETYSDNFQVWITDFLAGNPTLANQVRQGYEAISDTVLNWVNTNLISGAEMLLSSLGDLTVIFSGVISGVKVLVRLFKDLIIGFIVSGYLLVAKQHLIAQAKKITYSLFNLKIANYLLYEARFIHTVFGGFIRGKLLDSLIIGLLCFSGCAVLKIPYPIVVGVIVGITNIIPFFGPFIGAIPCGVLILLVNPVKCVYFVVFILLLQQFDGNFLGPKILGNTTGLSSFWVLFAIILFGGLFGFMGMIVGVPIFAVIYSLISAYVNHRLSLKKMSLNTADYELLDHVEREGAEFVHLKDPTVK